MLKNRQDRRKVGLQKLFLQLVGKKRQWQWTVWFNLRTFGGSREYRRICGLLGLLFNGGDLEHAYKFRGKHAVEKRELFL